MSNSNVPRWLAMFVSFLCFLPRPLHGLAMKLDCGPSWSTLGLYEQSLRACTLRTLLGWLGTLAGSWQHAHKRRTSNVLPSTIT